MPPASRKGDGTTGHGPFLPRVSKSGSGNVFTNNIAAMRLSDTFEKHWVGGSGGTPCTGIPTEPGCHELAMAEGSATVFINNEAATRIGDTIQCGEFMAIGSPTVYIGG